MTYHLIVRPDDDGGIALAPDDIDLFRLADPGEINDWEPPTLRLRGRFQDYLGNDLGWRLCSAALHEILVRVASPADRIQWLPCLVRDEASGEERTYHALHLVDHLDIVEDADHPGGDTVVRVRVDTRKAGSHRIFTHAGAFRRTIVDDHVVAAVRTAGCTGIEFAPVAST